jgi:myo-inositol-1(or 4)-monophosphatase
VRPSGPLATSLIATGFGYAAPERAAQARVLVEVLPQVRDIRRAGSAALDLCAVAAGTLDGYYEEGVNAWDVAAGWLLVAEAGGLVTGWHGRPPVDPAVVAGPLGVHAALLAALEAVVPAPASTSGPPM